MTRDNDPTHPSDAPGARESGGGATAATTRDTRGHGHDPEVIARHDSETGDVNLNHPDLDGRRGAREEGRPVRLTVNQAFVEQVGPEGLRSYVDVLARVGEATRRVPVAEVTERLLHEWSAAGLHVEPVEAGKIAERVADPTRGPLIVVDADNNELYGHDVTEGGQRSARQEEPDDPERPFWA